jgi:hypothetical protein
MRLDDTTERAAIISRIAAVALPKFAKQPLFAQLAPLQTFLSDRSPLIIQSFNKALPVEEVVRVLLLDLVDGEAPNNSVTDVTLGDGGADVSSGPKSLGLSQGALRRTLIEDPSFLEAVDEIMQEDITTLEGRISALETAYLSGCVIFTRFFAHPKLLVAHHKVFSFLFSCLGAAPIYFGRAQAAGVGV